jgi:hypothetical protein
LAKSQAATPKQGAAPQLNPAFPRFAKRPEHTMACELKRLQTADIDACEAYCANNRECVGFSYSRSSKVCSLKHTSSALRYDPLWETGVRPGFQVPRESIKNLAMDTNSRLSDYGSVLKGKKLDESTKDSLDECANYCLREKNCRGVTFTASVSICQRLETIEQVSDDASDHLRDGSGAILTTEVAIKRQK